MQSLHYTEIKAFLEALRGVEGMPARCLEFLILTVARTAEARLAEWSEFDFSHGSELWTVPRKRMKRRRTHYVPLAPAVVERLQIRPENKREYVLWTVSRRGEVRAIFKNAMQQVLARMNRDRKWLDPRTGDTITVHGFRSTFRDWAADCTNFPWQIPEKCLSHKAGDDTEKAYQRSGILNKRRRLMNAWAEFCLTPAKSEPSGNLSFLRKLAGQ